MATLQPNTDFLNSKDKPHTVERVNATQSKLFGSPAPKGKVNKSAKTKAEIEKEKKYRELFEAEKDKYPEYCSLSDYHRKCLPATNYWRVIDGLPIIEVPAWDLDYHKYFDSKCYQRAGERADYKRRVEENIKDNMKHSVQVNTSNQKVDKVEVPEVKSNKEVKSEVKTSSFVIEPVDAGVKSSPAVKKEEKVEGIVKIVPNNLKDDSQGQLSMF